MKKNRNAFFTESSFAQQAQFPNPTMNVANAPFVQNAYANGGFYAGSMPNNMPSNYNTVPNNISNYNNEYADLEARLAKIERSLNRLDARVAKLENNSTYNIEDLDTNNIYMV